MQPTATYPQPAPYNRLVSQPEPGLLLVEPLSILKPDPGYRFLVDQITPPLAEPINPGSDDKTTRLAKKMYQPVDKALRPILSRYLACTRLSADAVVSLTKDGNHYTILVNPAVADCAVQIGLTWIVNGLVSSLFNEHQLADRESMPWQ